MRGTFVAILAFALSGTPAVAQMNMNHMAPAMPPARPPVSGARLAKALEFLSVSGTREQIEQYIKRVTPQAIMMAQRQLNPNAKAAQKDLEMAMTAEMKNGGNELLTGTARVYAAHFSDQELDALTAFYKAPAGRKYASLRQGLMMESSGVVKAWAMKMNMVTIKGIVQKVAQAHPGAAAAQPQVPARSGGPTK